MYVSDQYIGAYRAVRSQYCPSLVPSPSTSEPAAVQSLLAAQARFSITHLKKPQTSVKYKNNRNK